MIQFVNDPFVDAGIAVLEYRLNKSATNINQEDAENCPDEKGIETFIQPKAEGSSCRAE